MENLFNLSNEKLKILLNGYFVWCNKNEEQKKYPGLEKQKSEEKKLGLTKNIFQAYPMKN